MQTFYTVKPGDSVSAIAKRWEVPNAALIAANNLESSNTIYPGQQLALPPGVVTVQVKPGDSVYSLAQMYGIPMAAIIQVNRFQPPYTIYIDQSMMIPPGVPYYVVQPRDTLYAIASRYVSQIEGACPIKQRQAPNDQHLHLQLLLSEFNVFQSQKNDPCDTTKRSNQSSKFKTMSSASGT